jgi:D-alanyl-D-alanine carboxypeptidase
MKKIILILMMFPLLVNSQEVEELLEGKLTDNNDSPIHGLSLLMERDGKVLVNEAVGKRHKHGEALEITDQFRIASSTKTFVATIILQMEEEGKLSLSDSIYPYLNSRKFLKLDDWHVYNSTSFIKEVTIEQLLSHKSGLADIFNDRQEAFFEKIMQNPNKQYSPKRIIDLYFEFGLNQEAKFAPGNGWHYSDMNYVLLGLLIEKLDEKSLAQSIHDRILEPLQLKDTYFEFYEESKSNKPRIHQYVGAEDFNRINTSFDWSGGGLVSTNQDLIQFITALFEGRLVSEKALQKMIAIQPTHENHLPYGLGVYQSVYGGQTFYGHYGFYGTYIGYCPETKTALSYCMTQAMPSFNVYEFVNSVIQNPK